MTEERQLREGAVATVVGKLRDMFLLGQLLPGEHVRQEEIAEQLGVARAPLREALNILAKQGPLIHKPNQGYFVAKRLPFEQAQVRRMLELLENELMRSMEWPTTKAFNSLELLHNNMQQYVAATNWTPILKLNREFHTRIFSLSPCKLILQQVDQLWTVAEPYQYAKLSTMSARARTVEEHASILAALRSQDRDACIAALDKHRTAGSEGIPYSLEAQS